MTSPRVQEQEIEEDVPVRSPRDEPEIDEKKQEVMNFQQQQEENARRMEEEKKRDIDDYLEKKRLTKAAEFIDDLVRIWGLVSNDRRAEFRDAYNRDFAKNEGEKIRNIYDIPYGNLGQVLWWLEYGKFVPYVKVPSNPHNILNFEQADVDFMDNHNERPITRQVLKLMEAGRGFSRRKSGKKGNQKKAKRLTLREAVLQGEIGAGNDNKKVKAELQRLRRKKLINF